MYLALSPKNFYNYYIESYTEPVKSLNRFLFKLFIKISHTFLLLKVQIIQYIDKNTRDPLGKAQCPFNHFPVRLCTSTCKHGVQGGRCAYT